jgi:RND family efflux transporter MFP subunit
MKNWLLVSFTCLLVVAALLGTNAVIAAFRNPNQMDVYRSMVMDMKVRMPPGAVPVQTDTAREREFTGEVTYTGNADAFNDIAIYPRTTGWVKDLYVYAGDRVKTGQVLARLDNVELGSRVATAHAGWAAADRAVEQSLREREEAHAHVSHYDGAIEQAKAKLDYWKEAVKRSESLLKSNVVSLDEYQKELSEFKASEAAYKQSISEKHAAERALHSAAARVDQSIEQRRQMRLAARTEAIIEGYTVIRAPFSGVVLSRAIDLGALVQPQTEIMRIAQIDPMRIQAQVPLTDLKWIKKGAQAIVRSPVRSDTTFTGSVHAVFPVSDLQSRTGIVEVLVNNATGIIRPGDFVQVRFKTGQGRSAIAVPSKSILERNQYKAVWVNENGSAKLKYVTVGSSDGIDTEVVSGLKAGEKIITAGFANLQEGDALVAARYAGEVLAELPTAKADGRLSKDNAFKASRAIGHYVLAVALTKQSTQIGLNELSCELSSMHGSSSNVQIAPKWFMPSMAEMRVPPPIVRKVRDGTFAITVDATMPGLWQLDMNLSDGGTPVGSTSVTFEVE